MSAYDIAVLSRYAFKFPELIRLSSIYLDYIQGPRKDKFMLDNKNKLLKLYPGSNGLKTGMTNEAGYCIAATALRDGTQLIAVVLGSESRDMRSKETKQLLDYGFANYASVLVAKGGEAQSDVKVFRGRKDRVSVATPEDFAVSINKGDKGKLKKEIVLNKSVNAPIRKGDKLGDIVAIVDGQEIERAPLLALEDVGKTSIPGLTLKFFGGLFRFR
jgi:D-alanyl-D-alanine carboxypeptidase (penicillin-binding protein 5/6)